MSWLTGIVFFQMICEMFKGKLKLQLQNMFEQYRWVRLKIRPRNPLKMMDLVSKNWIVGHLLLVFELVVTFVFEAVKKSHQNVLYSCFFM